MKNEIIDNILKEAGLYDNLIKMKTIANFDFLPQKVRDIIKKSFLIKRLNNNVAGINNGRISWQLIGNWFVDDDNPKSLVFYGKQFETINTNEKVTWDRIRGLKVTEFEPSLV